MSLTGHKETGPTRIGIPIADVVAGLIGLLTVQGQRQLSLGDTPEVAGNDHI